MTMTRIEAHGTTQRGEGVSVELVLDVTCEQGCGGRGMVPHPLWVEFNRADELITSEQGIAHALGAEHRAWERAWWRERGYPVTVDVGFDHGLPPTEVPCDVCEGRGRILTATGRELAAFIQRTQAQG
ncbi:MAG: hypothetical protein GEU80_17945 [Dehalococcoidia bacterium]|nr:hypothetical protein [Dehalococcoidia bacterium]